MASPSDLTARARIRDAALRQFAAAGVAATSIRDVAQAAGVSPGLVQHHFRSKVGLRSAVDAFVIQRATDAFGVVIADGPAEQSAMQLGTRISSFIRANPDAFAYIGRSLVADDAPGTELFQQLLGLARAQLDRLAGRKLLRVDLDPDWAALHVILIDVGAFLLEPTLTRFLGEPLRGGVGLKRMEDATRSLFLKGIYRPERRRRRVGRGHR